MKNNKLLNLLIKYAVCVIPAGLIATLVLSQHGYKEAATDMERYRILCDAFTIPGVILIMVGALIWISNTGFFDGISYSVGIALKRLLPFASIQMEDKYYDYKMRKKEARLKGYHFVFITGAVFLAAALFFMYKFYQLF